MQVSRLQNVSLQCDKQQRALMHVYNISQIEMEKLIISDNYW